MRWSKWVSLRKDKCDNQSFSHESKLSKASQKLISVFYKTIEISNFGHALQLIWSIPRNEQFELGILKWNLYTANFKIKTTFIQPSPWRSLWWILIRTHIESCSVSLFCQFFWLLLIIFNKRHRNNTKAAQGPGLHCVENFQLLEKKNRTQDLKNSKSRAF